MSPIFVYVYNQALEIIPVPSELFQANYLINLLKIKVFFNNIRKYKYPAENVVDDFSSMIKKMYVFHVIYSFCCHGISNNKKMGKFKQNKNLFLCKKERKIANFHQ